MTKFISESGCSANLKDSDGKCLIQLALEGGHDAVVMYLFLEHGAEVTQAKGLRNIKEAMPDCLHTSLIKTCVEKTADRDKAFQVSCEALAHSSNPIISALLLAEMYWTVSKHQPTHRHTLEQNKEIMEKVAFSMLDDIREEDVMMIIGGEDPAFGNISPINVAIRSHISSFISHPLTQDYISQIWKGDDPLQRAFLKDEKNVHMFWDFILKPKIFFGSPRGHFFLHIYTYVIFIIVHMQVSMRLSVDLGNNEAQADWWEHLFTVLTLCGLLNELEKLYRQGWNHYLEFFWNYADIALFMLLLVFMVMRSDWIEVDQIYIRNVLGLSAIPLYVRLLELLVLSRRFGPLMLIIQNVLSEVFYFLFLALLMIVAFAQTVTLMFNDPGRELEFFRNVGHSSGTLFIAMLGIMDEGQINEMREKYVWTGPFVMILYLLITSVILLNLLIAILSNIYKKIDEKSNEEWMFLWGSTVMRLQKEVSETLPAPLNVILKLLKIFPKKISKSVVFFCLMLTAYVPGFIIGFTLYGPIRLFRTVIVLVNPLNWKNGGGNPFKGAQIMTMDSTLRQHMDDHSEGRRDRAKNVISQFWIDNFTDNEIQMRGREGVNYQYDSKNRGTIVDLAQLKEKKHADYLIKLSERREEIRDILSISTSDTSSLVTDVINGQEAQNQMFEDQIVLTNKLKKQMFQLEKLIQIANRNINSLSKAEETRWSNLGDDNLSAAAGPAAVKTVAKQASVQDLLKDNGMLPSNAEPEPEATTLITRGLRGTKAFNRPRRTTKLK